MTAELVQDPDNKLSYGVGTEHELSTSSRNVEGLLLLTVPRTWRTKPLETDETYAL